MDGFYKDLEIEDDIRFHKTQWVIQRAGRCVMLFFLAAAAFGYFGTGFISKQTAVSGGLEVEYDKYGRLLRNSGFTVRLPAQDGPRAELWIDNAFLEKIKMEFVNPEPVSVRTDGAGTAYVFETSGREKTAVVFFGFRPREPGKFTPVLRAGRDAGEVRLALVVYP